MQSMNKNEREASWAGGKQWGIKMIKRGYVYSTINGSKQTRVPMNGSLKETSTPGKGAIAMAMTRMRGNVGTNRVRVRTR